MRISQRCKHLSIRRDRPHRFNLIPPHEATVALDIRAEDGSELSSIILRGHGFSLSVLACTGDRGGHFFFFLGLQAK
jgi:hypothetical protein